VKAIAAVRQQAPELNERDVIAAPARCFWVLGSAVSMLAGGNARPSIAEA
jgi:hypothetical protein